MESRAGNIILQLWATILNGPVQELTAQSTNGLEIHLLSAIFILAGRQNMRFHYPAGLRYHSSATDLSKSSEAFVRSLTRFLPNALEVYESFSTTLVLRCLLAELRRCQLSPDLSITHAYCRSAHGTAVGSRVMFVVRSLVDNSNVLL